MEYILNDFLNGLLCRKDIKIKSPICSNIIAEAVNEYLKNQPKAPETPTDVSDEAIKIKAKHTVFVPDCSKGEAFRMGAKWMRDKLTQSHREEREEYFEAGYRAARNIFQKPFCKYDEAAQMLMKEELNKFKKQ